MDTTPLLFVSHSHEDDTFCQRLIADLRANLGDACVWYDVSGGLHGGDDWWNRIIAEITERPYFLVVLSPNASASKWVPQEMAIAFRQHVELGKRLLPVRLAESPRREDWRGIQEFDFTHNDDPARYAAALAEVLRFIDPKLTMPVISAPSVSPMPAAPERPLSPTERLAKEVHTAYAREHWSDVLDKTEILVERGVMTPALWRERASAAFALGDTGLGLAVIKQALQAGVDDADTLLLYARLTAKSGNDAQAVEILTRAYALVSLDDTATRLAILDELTTALARQEQRLSGDNLQRVWGVRDDFARRVHDARRMAPNDLRWALREVKVLLNAGRYDEVVAAARMLPNSTDVASELPLWHAVISKAAGGPWDGKNWLAYRALLDAAAAAGIGSSTIARWRFEFPHFVQLVTLSRPDGNSGLGLPAWSPSGDRLAIASRDGLRVWDSASGQLLATFSYPSGFVDGVALVTWSPDGTRLVARGGMWDVVSGQLLAPQAVTGIRRALGNLSGRPTTKVQGILSSGVWSPNGKWVATTFDRDVLAQVWDTTNGHLILTIPGHNFWGSASVTWAPEGRCSPSPTVLPQMTRMTRAHSFRSGVPPAEICLPAYLARGDPWHGRLMAHASRLPVQTAHMYGMWLADAK